MRNNIIVAIALMGLFAIVIASCSPDVPPGPGAGPSANASNGTAQGQGLSTRLAGFFGNGSSGKADDWAYSGPSFEAESAGGMLGGISRAVGGAMPGMALQSASPMVKMASDIGFSVGGAKDINAFRENVKNNYLPIPTDITYEGLFYDYYFDTGESQKCTELFCPSYTTAVVKDPLSGADDHYMSVGLNSGVQDFHRKKLNLVVVLDISGSMSSPFNAYYYDKFGNANNPAGTSRARSPDEGRSKMELATKSLAAMIGHLNDDDRFGMVMFDDRAYLGKPLSPVKSTDMAAVKKHILELRPQGGTYMEAGIKAGTALYYDVSLDEVFKLPEVRSAMIPINVDSPPEMKNPLSGLKPRIMDPQEYENRVVFLTDAMPNLGDTSAEGLYGMMKRNADNGIYTTFIGIGVDLNTELVEKLTKIRGANYYSVHSSDEFSKRLDEEFEYMVTPLVFNLDLKLDADGFDIQKVYGSPEADEATGEIMKVNTLFPSKKEDGQTRGGLVLLKLKKTSNNPRLNLVVTYEDRTGKTFKSEAKVEFPAQRVSGDLFVEREISDYHFDNTGIRKGVLLSRYADLMKAWLIDERKGFNQSKVIAVPYDPRAGGPIDTPIDRAEEGGMPSPTITKDTGILPPPRFIELGQWERQSLPLRVSPHYKDIFKEFRKHFEEEARQVSDKDLEKELAVFDALLAK